MNDTHDRNDPVDEARWQAQEKARRGDPDAGVVALSAVSAARALIAVRGLHKFAAAEGITDVDVARAVKPPTPGRRLPKSLTIDEVLALLEGAGGDGPSGGRRGCGGGGGPPAAGGEPQFLREQPGLGLLPVVDGAAGGDPYYVR